ncbi:carboxypeptidase C prc1 [Mortierella sp. AD011]|nr:carboxypeptidase C prc1 [Mortierella sp. AD011]
MDHLSRTLVSIGNNNSSLNGWSAGKYLSSEHATSATTEANTSATTSPTSATTITFGPTTAIPAINATSTSTSGTMTVVQSESITPYINPESQRGQDTDQDSIWVCKTAEIEDLMCTLEDHCRQLGLDPSNVSRLLILPFSAPVTLTTRQSLHRACDDLYQDILRRKERIERWVSRIITIAENIREPPELYLETTMPPMSRARILQLERTYRTLEIEWMSRLQRFQSMVGMLRVRWEQCAYFPADDCDHALNRLFELAELDEGAEFSYLRIEAPLCLSRECLANLSTKLADLDQNFYTRQSRIRAMEHVLGLIYQDLRTPIDKRVTFRNEATVKYAAELGRELKALQLELTARKAYQSGEPWKALAAVWDTCLVSEQERERFRSAIDQDDVIFSEKLERIQTEMETCQARFSKSSAVYKLMMTRSNHIERMISFEHSASDPKRLFQSSFQLVEEEKFRRRAYPTLLKLERTLIEAIEAFEKDNEDPFMYEGVPYLETLQAEIDKRHVNETVFAKFTPVIAAPTRSQTIQIIGQPVSSTPKPSLPAPVPRTSQKSKNLLPPTRSMESSRRSKTVPSVLSLASSLPNREAKMERAKDNKKSSSNEEDTSHNGFVETLKPYFLAHQRETSSTTSLGSSHSLKSKSSNSSLTMTSTSASASASTSNSPLTEIANNTNSYFTSFTSSTTNPSTPSAPLSSSSSSLSSSSSSLSLISGPSVLAQSLPVSPKQDLKSPQHERASLSSSLKSPPGVSGNSASMKSSMTRSPVRRVGV